jgi:hypothetical protein
VVYCTRALSFASHARALLRLARARSPSPHDAASAGGAADGRRQTAVAAERAGCTARRARWGEHAGPQTRAPFTVEARGRAVATGSGRRGCCNAVLMRRRVVAAPSLSRPVSGAAHFHSVMSWGRAAVRPHARAAARNAPHARAAHPRRTARPRPPASR